MYDERSSSSIIILSRNNTDAKQILQKYVFYIAKVSISLTLNPAGIFLLIRNNASLQLFEILRAVVGLPLFLQGKWHWNHLSIP